jgi:hypothetical protein
MTEPAEKPLDTGNTPVFPPIPLKPIASTAPTVASEGPIGEVETTGDNLAEIDP